MKYTMLFSILICLILQNGVKGENRILSEISDSSTKWQFRQFSTQVEQNMETIVLPNDQLLFVQSQVDDKGQKNIILQKYKRDSTKIGQPLIIGDQGFQCSRAKVSLIRNVGFALGWIGTQIEQSNFYIQIFNEELQAITEQQYIGSVHLEVHWDMVSEFHYLKQIKGTKLLLFFKPPNVQKIWNGLVYDYQENIKTDQITIPYSKILEIAINQISTIVILQTTDNSSETRFTIMNIYGQIVRTKIINQQQNGLKTQSKLAALSNNNFILFSNQAWNSLFVYDSRFSTILKHNAYDYNPNYFSGIEQQSQENYHYINFNEGLNQLQALEESFVIVGVDKISFKFRLVHLKNNLKFIQYREVYYENLNIYKYFIQQTEDNTIFVQWIDGQPETLLFEQKQSLYQSELNLQLSINPCSSNCDSCISIQHCVVCQNNYNLINNKCEPKCIDNCQVCSNPDTCQICNDGYFFDNQLKCIQDLNYVQEVRISNSDTTNKEGSKIKVLENRNIVMIYKEQSQKEELLQLKLLDQYGKQIQNQQIQETNLLNYDFVVDDQIIYVYLLIQSTDGKFGLKVYQFSFEDLQLLKQQQLPQQYSLYNLYMIHYYSHSNFFKVIKFVNSVTIIFAGFVDYSKQSVVSYTYDFDGNNLNNQFYGDSYIGNFFFSNTKQFDAVQVENLMYLVVVRQCELYLTVQDEFGSILRQETFNGDYVCKYYLNPSISRTPKSLDILIALTNAFNNIQVFSWFYNEQLLILNSEEVLSQPQIISLDSKSFILIYLVFNIEHDYVTINYLHYDQGQIKSQKIINQHSIQPTDVSYATFFDNGYVYLAWTGFKNQMNIFTNQVYLQQISVNDDQIIGLIKICDPNCIDCGEQNICQACQQGYFLTQEQKCQLKCIENCYYCEQTSTCNICNVRYQLNGGQCQLNESNLFAKLSEGKNRIQFNPDIAINYNGNIIVSWLNYETNINHYRAHIKTFDNHGNQINDQVADICYSSLQRKLFNMNEKSWAALLCDDGQLMIAVLDMNEVDVLRWQQLIKLEMINTIPQNIYFDIKANNLNQIFLIASTPQNQIYVSRFIYDSYFYIKQEMGDYKYSLESNIQNVEISVTSDFIYFSFVYSQFNSDTGVNEILTRQIKGDYNFNEIQSEIVESMRLSIILYNNNILRVSKKQTDLQLQISISGSQQLLKAVIKTDQNIQNFDIAQFQHGFVVVWTSQGNFPELTLNSQVFFNNGTQITNITQLPSFSNFPSDPKVESLKNGDFMIVWNDIDSSGQSLFAARYNQYLTQIPLTQVICQELCEVCLTPTSCQRCIAGYYLDKQTCKIYCSENCAYCNFSGQCDICQEQYYLKDNICHYDNQRVEEEIVSNVQDVKNTRVSITSFSDTSFVVAWNDNLSGVQSIQFQFYDTQRNPNGNIKTLQGELDRQYVQIKSIANEKLAVIWLDGDCSVQCRLILQIFDKQLIEYTSQTIIALVTLPYINNQLPIQIQRQDNKLIIAYLSYENSQTTAYYTIYLIDSLTQLTPIQIETSDVKVDNLDIIVYNSDIYYIIYVVNSIQLKSINFRNEQVTNSVLYDNKNTIETPTHMVNSISGIITVAWSEKLIVEKKNNQRVMYQKFNTEFTPIQEISKVEFYYLKWMEQPKIIYQDSESRIGIFFKSFDILTKGDQQIQYFSDMDGIKQISYYSFEHHFFTFEQINQQEIILVDVGRNSQLQPSIFISRKDIFGFPLKMGQIICPLHCYECLNNHSCQSCEPQYSFWNGVCLKSCPENFISCDQDQFICSNGYYLTEKNECIPLDENKTQKLINTYQLNNQGSQNIATLTNYYSVVVWQSRQQNLNGVSIYMQKYDPQFNKIGPEFLITKDSIGIQQAPNIVAVSNNNFIVIWRDSNSENHQRILMQKFSFDFNKVGNEVVVFDQATDSLLEDVYYINYRETNYELLSLQNDNLAILLRLSYYSDKILQVTDLRLKLFDSQLKEFNNQLIGSNYGQQLSDHIISIENNIYIIWRDFNDLKIVALNENGDMVNGQTIQSNNVYQLFTITKNELGQLVVGWADQKTITIKRFDLSLQSIGDTYTMNFRAQPFYLSNYYNWYLTQIQLLQIKGGIAIIISSGRETYQFPIHSITLEILDNCLMVTSKLKQINDYTGHIENIQSSRIGNGQFVITWKQILNFDGGSDVRREKDLSDGGIYVKKFDTQGNILPVTSLVCQTNCNQCSQLNLCESCEYGYQFDSTKQICQLLCPDNCLVCNNDTVWRLQCTECKEGYVLNGDKECSEIQDKNGKELYYIGEKSLNIRVFDQITLQNGNIVILYSKDYCKEIYFKIIDNQGIVIVEERHIWSGDQCILVRATALTQGHFAVVHRSFYTQNSNEIRLHIYDVDGSQIRNYMICNYSLWSYYYWWDWQAYNQNLLAIKQLINGGFIVIFMNDNNGRQFIKPKIYLRIFGSNYYQISSDIQLSSNIIDNNHGNPSYWNWWNQNSNLLSFIETETSLIVMQNLNILHWWEGEKNQVKIINIDKSTFSQTSKILDISYNVIWGGGIWWYRNFQNLQLWLSGDNQFLLFRPFPQGLRGYFLDNQFNIISEKIVFNSNFFNNDENFYCPECCSGCCLECWNQYQFQLIQLDEQFVLSYYQQQCFTYQCQLTSKIFTFGFNLDKINGPQEIQYVIQNSLVLSDNKIMRKYLNNNILLMSVFQLSDSIQVSFDKINAKGTKLQKWEPHCPIGCKNCENINNIIKCLDCQEKYFMDVDQSCKLSCDYEHCLTCNLSLTKKEYCVECEDGYQIKDNSSCGKKNENQITEQKLDQSMNNSNSIPKIKVLQDGTIVIVLLKQIDHEYVIYGQFMTNNGQNVGDLLELQRSTLITNFDFSVSNSNSIILVWTDQSTNIIIKGQRYDANFTPYLDQMIIFQYIEYWNDERYAAVEYLADDSLIVILFGGRCLLMNKYDQNMNKVIDLYSFGCNWEQDQIFQADDYYTYLITNLSYQAPLIVFNQNYFVILYFNQQSSNQLQLRTFDYDVVLQYSTTLQYNSASQPSLSFLENGNLAVVWKDQLLSFSSLYSTEVPFYQQSTLIYVITDPQYSFIQYKYIGMDYINELQPDIQSIPNGFALSWSGVSEKHSQYIDLRIIYLDLNGNQLTGVISVSTICSSPKSSQISSLRDGSIIISWFQNEWIYMQKIDKYGVIQQLNTIICANHCGRCASQNDCEICQNGYSLNSSNQCVDICLINNCASCQYSSIHCQLCNNEYFLNESLQQCDKIDQQDQKQPKLLQNSNVYSESTVFITNSYGDLIHIWINFYDDKLQIFVESYSKDGSLIVAEKIVPTLINKNYKLQSVYNEQYKTIIILLVNQASVLMIKLNDNFEMIGDQIELISTLEKEFTHGFSKLTIKSSVDGFALIASGKKQKIYDQFGSNPKLAICDVLEILLLNLNGNLILPAISFWSDNRLGNGLFDQFGICYRWDLKDVQLEDQIYLILSNIDDRTQMYIQIYDYNGQKIREKLLKDFINWDQWWKSVTLQRNYLGEFYILGQSGQLLKLNSQFNFISVEDLGFNYDNEIRIISLSQQYLVAITKQQQYQIKRYKLWIYNLIDHVIVKSDFISHSAVYQDSFSYINQNNGNLIFTWQEIGQNTLNIGSQYIVRFDYLGQWIKFEQFSCLPNCNQCTVANKCEICSDNYHLDQTLICIPNCSDNCKNCSIPLTCDVCNYGYYSDDYQQCQSKEGQPSEKPISSQTSSSQIHIRVAQFSDGSSVMVWQSDTQDGSGFGVYAQKFDSAGNKKGDEIRVNINIKGQQYFPDVTTLSNGNIIIIWVDGDIETQAQLFYQQFDNDLKRIGSPVFIDYITVSWITYLDVPCVVQSLIGKQFAVIWITFDPTGQQITFVTVIDENGVRINTTPLYNYDSNKEIVVSSNGFTLVVIYRQYGVIQGSIFDMNGLFQNTVPITTTIASSPGITVDSSGQYIIAWQSNGIIYYQIFEGTGLQGLGQPFTVQIIDGVFMDNPDVVAQSNGFIIVWQNRDIIGKRSRKIRIQLFDKNGVSLGNSIEVDIDTIYGEYPQLSLLNNDEFVVVWSAQNIDSNIDEGSGIYMIKFSSNGLKLSLGGITCPNRCQNCSNQDTCIKCVEDYKLVQGVCVPQCADNCGSCSTPLFCDICSDGYKLDPSGYCSSITPDILQEAPLLAEPLLSLPSFSSSIQIIDGVIVYSGSVINIGISYYLEVNLQMIAGDNSNQFIYKIPIASTTTNIIHSDVIIRDDKSIQIYWVEVIREVIRIKVITISYVLEIIEQETIIDTIWITDSDTIHDESRVYLYYQNSQYYVIHSVYSSSYNYDVYQHQISTQYVRITQPVHIMVLTRQISYTQILFSIDQVVFLEYTETYILRTYRFTIDFASVQLRESNFNFGFSNYANSFMLRRLRSGGYVVCWRSYTTWTLSSRSYIYYTMFNDNLDRVSDNYVISQSNGVLGNPQIIVQEDKFAVIWNTQISITYSQLSISYYTNYGGYISTTTQLNTISNNIQYYYATVTIDYRIIINWISRVTIELLPQYQYYIVAIDHDGKLIASPSLKCQSKCSTCNNQYTCLTCATNYYYDDVSKDCLPKCPDQCQSCSIPTACLVCNEGYTLNTTTNFCEKNPCNPGCDRCNLKQECNSCGKNYILNNQDMRHCIPTCPKNCGQCTVAPVCDFCETSYYWSDKYQECVDFDTVIFEHPRKDPLIATFPTKDYVEMWIQGEPLPGIYFQLYRANGTTIGSPTKVNTDNTTGNRRLLQVGDYQKNLFSDLTTFQNEFIVVWVDQTIGDLQVKFKKFNLEGKAISEEIKIKELPKQRLEGMAAPCQIQKASGDNFIVGFLQRIENQVESAATLFIQSFNKNMEPLGILQSLNNIDYKKAAMISASEDGRISITFSSNGFIYLTQISMEGNYLYEPMKVADGKAFKSTNLKNNKIVFVFEAVSTDVSPPQYILEFEIMDANKKLSEPVMITSLQNGEEHPVVTSFASDFIVAWRTVDITLQSQDIYFQLFDEFGQPISQQIKVDRQGIKPKNPSVQIINEDEFYITWTGQSINGTDGFYTQSFKRSTLNNDKSFINQIEQDKNITNTIICNSNCIVCENSNKCNECSNGYYEINGQCEIDCGIHCSKCSKSFECDICEEGYFINQLNSCELIDCEQGYQLNENYECVPSCSDNCTACESFNICLTCQDSYQLIEGKCLNILIINENLHEESSSIIQIVCYILGSIVLSGILILITWYIKKKKTNQQHQFAQPQQVIDERQETYLDFTSSRVN